MVGWNQLDRGPGSWLRSISMHGVESGQRDYVKSTVHSPVLHLSIPTLLQHSGHIRMVRVHFITTWRGVCVCTTSNTMMDECNIHFILLLCSPPYWHGHGGHGAPIVPKDMVGW